MFLPARQFMVIAPASLPQRFSCNSGENELIIFQETIIFQRIVRNPVHHFLKQLRIVVNIVHHLFHLHKMNDHLCGNTVKASHVQTHRKDITEGLLQRGAPLFRPFQVNAVGGFFQFAIILFQILYHRLKLMADRAVQPADLNLYIKQRKPGIIRYRKIIRRHPVIIKQLLIQKIAVQLRFYLPCELSFASKPLRNDFLRKGAKLQVDHGPLPLQGIVLIPFSDALFILLSLGKLQLFLRQLPQYFPILRANIKFIHFLIPFFWNDTLYNPIITG